MLTAFALAPSAQAGVTNPADNPHPITVKGDDGKTYTDGQDTLPGYDDEECTYIPGAYFDFDNNRVRYADGQSIPWTEWERATGYKDWLAKNSGPKPSSSSTPKPSSSSTPKPGGASTPKPGGASTPKPGSSSTPKPSSTTTKSSSTAKSSTTEPSAGATATDEATAAAGPTSPTDGATAAAGAKTGTGAQATPSDPAAGEVDEVALAAGASGSSQASKGATDPSSGTGSAGLLILGGLAGVGLLTFAGYSVFGRRSRRAT
jgi:hypothetical protein